MYAPPTLQHTRQRAASRGSATRECLVHVANGPLKGPPPNAEAKKTASANKTNQKNKPTDNGGIQTKKKPAVRLSNKQRIESKLLNLTLDVHGLREELRSFEICRAVLRARVLQTAQAPEGSIVRTARQYFHVFRRGYRETDAKTQLAFLQAVTHDALSMGTTGLGRTMLFEQWRRYADYFAFRFLTPPVLSVIPSSTDGTCIVRCETKLNGSFTWQALEMVFPAVKRDPQLMQRLLGREMITPMCFHLHFDRKGRMVRHDFEADFFAALVHALKDPVSAAEIVASAKVAEEGMVNAIAEAKETEGESFEESREVQTAAVKWSGKDFGDEGDQQTQQRRVEPTESSRQRHSVGYLLS